MASVTSLQSQPALPRDERFDSTFAMRCDPYGYIQKRWQRFGEYVFEARVMSDGVSPA